MPRAHLVAILALLCLGSTALLAEEVRPTQYILLNRAPGTLWNQGRANPIPREGFDEIRRALPDAPGSRIRVGVAFIFSYLHSPQENVTTALRQFLRFAQETNTPVLVQLDGESWWEARPDLWNWWDPNLPGYDPANRDNVEWSGWTSESAIKIAWRNWGRQIRVRPAPNLMSPRYRKACREQMALLIPIIVDWSRSLPPEKKDLLVGVKVGWESSIGVNAWYYPDGNNLLGKPAAEDPVTGLKTDQFPGRGVTTIGYAAVKTAGLRSSGQLTEADLAEIPRRHLEDLCQQAAELGVPRDKLFTHGAGWKDDELLYRAAVNRFSCPGWSFYRHAGDPRKDTGVQEALKQSDAPFWAASEWLYQGPTQTPPWRSAIANTLADPRCRFLCIFNWEGICKDEPVLEAIRQELQAGAK